MEKDTVVEGRLKSKLLYKLFLLTLKYIPILITISYILNTLLYWFGIDFPILSHIAGMSLLTWVFMYLATYVFQFCSYHRLLLYFILANDLINVYDYYYLIPVQDFVLLEIYTSLIGLLIIFLVIDHVKNNKRSPC